MIQNNSNALEKKIIYVTGLPRAGSTLLCQLLGIHPHIYSIGHSSPLCPTLMKLRSSLSENPFLLSQLDVDFDLTYQRLINSFHGFMNGWFLETPQPCVVDKNRGWLHHLETLYSLDPNFRMLVCVRELGQIYGSIEAQHQKTILLDFPDNLASLSPFDRADKLFNNSGVIGSPLHAIEVIQDLNSELQQRLYYVVFEHLMLEPLTVMKNIYEWLGLSPISFNPQQLPVKSSESDSHYHFKYLHRTYTQIQSPNSHVIPNRIQSELLKKYLWFYQTFYPGLLK